METETARKAAKWWADQLRNGAKLDNGDPSNGGGMAMVMGLMLQHDMAAKRTPEQIQAFEDALVDVIQEQDEWQLRMGFGVDYHPDDVLTAAIDRSGVKVDMTCLPWKTHMRFDGDQVRVSCGYGAPSETL